MRFVDDETRRRQKLPREELREKIERHSAGDNPAVLFCLPLLIVVGATLGSRLFGFTSFLVDPMRAVVEQKARNLVSLEGVVGAVIQALVLARSEERRVGKECRSRWS